MNPPPTDPASNGQPVLSPTLKKAAILGGVLLLAWLIFGPDDASPTPPPAAP